LCSRQQRFGNAVKTLRHRIERHAAAFILNMFKTNATAWRLHSVLDRALWGRCANAVGSSRALWAHRVHAVKTPCKSCIWTRRLQ